MQLFLLVVQLKSSMQGITHNSIEDLVTVINIISKISTDFYI
jgi:hypothetical protein